MTPMVMLKDGRTVNNLKRQINKESFPFFGDATLKAMPVRSVWSIR